MPGSAIPCTPADSLDVVSLFDFEVATLGPPEVDLAHWVYLDEVFSENFGVPRIDGLPRGNDAVAGFERIYGRPMPHFSFYMAVAALKILILSVRNYGNDKDMVRPPPCPTSWSGAWRIIWMRSSPVAKRRRLLFACG